MAHLYRIFASTVERFGARVAVEVQRKDSLDRYTYADLHALTLDRARRLLAAGIGRGDRCAILAHNDAHWCAAYLGALAAGAIVVPLDTNYAAAQVRTVLQDAGARVLFTSERLRDVARDAASGLDVVLLDVHEPAGERSSETLLPDLDDEPDAAAVILYTSGTTADPKGVVLSHANLVAERDAAFAVIHVEESDSVLGVLPLFHSLAQLANLLLPFAVGARVVYLETLGSQELVRALSDRRITVFACVPQFFYLIHERILKEVDKRGMAARLVFRTLLAGSFRLRRAGLNLGPRLFSRVHALLGPQMRLLITGGSRFDPAVGRDLYALGFTILQAYGLTETSGAATITGADDAHVDTVGPPLPGVELKIVRAEDDDRYENDSGEIAIRGPIVMRGYFNRPDATAAVMRDGWFLTGDLGRLDERGRLTITGRKKDVIILANGKNLYPEEIEAHYRQSPFVKEVCVTTVGSGGSRGGERLYAVVVPDMARLRERKIVNAGELLRFELEGLGATLPAHKRVLGYELSLEPLPRTTTGKLKRHEIAARLTRGGAAGESGSETPAADAAWTAEPHVARALAVVQPRVAGAGRLTPAANLELDLGLDSMQRVELLAELEQEFGVRFDEDQALRILTLGELVEAVRSSSADESEEGRGARGPSGDAAWNLLLEDLPPAADPVLGGLLRSRPLLSPVLYSAGNVMARLVADLRATGLENLPARGPFLICPNHQSYLDPFFVAAALPYRIFDRVFFVGAVEYFETAPMAWIARQIKCVPIDPDSNLVPAMKAGAFGLAHGQVLMLFPEGERSIDGTVKRFKKGAPILARHAGVPIVPVAIKGAFELWPRTRRLAWRRMLPPGRGVVRVRFGKPFTVLPGESFADAAARLRDVVGEMWKEL